MEVEIRPERRWRNISSRHEPDVWKTFDPWSFESPGRLGMLMGKSLEMFGTDWFQGSATYHGAMDSDLFWSPDT
jgi:hypothetical protein